MKRLIVYFHYDPLGQIDTACRVAVEAMAHYGEVFFISNGTLRPADRAWAASVTLTCRERENEGFDVGAYKEALAVIGRGRLARYDELVLMNFTLAGPVCSLASMFAAMEARQELAFWGLTRHYAMKSRRFGGRSGEVPEHLQSHFLAVRAPLLHSEDFWQYWQKMPLPKSYEESIANHETRFTAHFANLGCRWDSYVDTKDLRDVFVNPIMACPRELLANRGCPFFKRRSFFTPYADELRRTDGQAAAELYDYLKSETDYPVDDLLRALLPVQPLAAMAQNLHWHYILPQTAGECAPILLDANTLAKGCALQPDAVYCLPLPRAAGVEGYYYARSMPTSLQLTQAAELFDAHPLVGVLGPALPLYAGCAAEKARCWQQQKPAVQAKLSALDCPLPLDETPPPLPNGGCLLVRGAAFPQGLPPLQTESDFWLVPLLAQYNGYASATFETAAQCAARADVLDAALAAQRGVGPVFRLMGRTVKNALRKRKESAR